MYDHFANECRKKQKDLENHSANYSNVSNGNSDNLFITCNVAQESSKDVWLLDSDCSNHMNGNKEFFSNLDDLVKSKIKLGNDSTVPVMGKGVIN